MVTNARKAKYNAIPKNKLHHRAWFINGERHNTIGRCSTIFSWIDSWVFLCQTMSCEMVSKLYLRN